MRKISNKASKIVAIFMVIVLCISGTAFAQTSIQPIEMISCAELAVNSLPTPEAAKEYAQQNISRFLSAAVERGEKTATEINSMYMGNPFTLYNPDTGNSVYYFPVFDGSVVYKTLRVYYANNRYNGILSEMLVEVLNTYMGSASADSPVSFVVSGDYLYAVNGAEHTEVYCFETGIGEANPTTTTLTINEEATELVNCADVLCTVEYHAADVSLAAVNNYPNYYYIDVDDYITETQGQLPWCSAYVAAFLVRVRTGQANGMTASDVMAVCYPNETVAQRQSHALENSKTTQFYRNQGYSVDFSMYSRLTESETVAELIADRPIHLFTAEANASGSNHCIAMVGYSFNLNIWHVWNPWKTFTQDMDMDTITLDAGNGYYFEWFGQWVVQ